MLVCTTQHEVKLRRQRWGGEGSATLEGGVGGSYSGLDAHVRQHGSTFRPARQCLLQLAISWMSTMIACLQPFCAAGCGIATLRMQHSSGTCP